MFIRKKLKKLMLRINPPIPNDVMEQIRSVQELNVVYKKDITDEWNFARTVNDYLHENVLWRIDNSTGSMKIISKEGLEQNKNVLIQRLYFGENEEVYYYGIASFVKERKCWKYIAENDKVIRMRRLPTLNETCVRFLDEKGEPKIVDCQEYKDFYYTYEN